jgi:hypothetical protein
LARNSAITLSFQSLMSQTYFARSHGHRRGELDHVPDPGPERGECLVGTHEQVSGQGQGASG